MKKKYTKPMVAFHAIRSNQLMAASGFEPGDSEFTGEYGNEGNPGSHQGGEITGTGTGGMDEFTQGSKQYHYDIWEQWDEE